MAEIRGEKVKFGRGDYRQLHEMPSAQVEDPIIVHCPPPRSVARTLSRFLLVLTLLIVAAIGIVVGLVQSGSIDHVLTTQAKQALERTIDPRFAANVGSSSIRFNDNFRLALVAKDVDISDRESAQHLSRVADISMQLDPFALMIGRLSVDSLGVENVQLNTALLPKGDGFDFKALTVSSVPRQIDGLFDVLDSVSAGLLRNQTKVISLENLKLLLPSRAGDPERVVSVQTIQLSEKENGAGYQMTGEVDVDGVAASIELDAKIMDGKVHETWLRLDGFDVGPFLKASTIDGEVIEGIDAKVGVILHAKRAEKEAAPRLNLTFGVGNGAIYLSGEKQTLTGARIVANYDHEQGAIVIDQSTVNLGNSHLPLIASIKDGVKGPEFTAQIKGARISSSLGNEEPIPVDIRADGSFDKEAKVLSIPQLFATGPMGDLAGSLKIVFGDSSPEISFGGQIPRMQATAVKQLWPFWMAKKPRYWTHANIFGGTVTNGSIAVFIPKGRMCGYGCPMNLNEGEIEIKFDIADTRINVTGEIPPLRDADAKFHLVGGRLDVSVPTATAFFPSNRKLTLTDSNFAVQNFYEKPLLADVKLKVQGEADAVGELATLRPIHALQKTQFKPEDFTGSVDADVTLKVGIAASDNPQPIWNAKLALNDFSLKPQISGRNVKGVKGEMLLDQNSLRLTGKGRVDDIAADISYVQPLGGQSDIKQAIGLTASLSGSQLNKLAPGLTSLIGGTTKLTLNVDEEKRQEIKLDLTQSTLTIPGIGWQKGAGIPANASFNVKEDNGRLTIEDFVLKGDGFGAEGKLAINNGKLVSANFSRMQLSSSDSYAVSIKGNNNLIDVQARGSSVDLRSLMGRLRDGASAEAQKASSSKLSIDVGLKFDKALGFHDESMSNVDGVISVRDGKLQRVDFQGVSSRGQAVVGQTTRNGNVSTINLTSSDAGSLARFANLYSRINGGLLNLKLSTTNGESWSGSIDLRNFAVVNESKLQDIVSTPTGADGRSLNKAVRRDINVASERFQRAFARLVYVNGAVALENGVIRGEQIGATFQGLLRDRNGNMDMTGTFMPAYGLNRIFGELPIIGAILGNGTDRGLLGITFKLTGKTAAPNLAVNPLSLIAPGIFRQIFEFQ